MEHPIFSKIENANKPDFGDILSKSFELFKKVWEQALYHALMSMVVVIPMILLIYIPYIAFIFYMGGFDGYNSYDTYGYYNEPDLTPYIPVLILYLIAVFILIFLVQAVVYGITAHFIRVLKKVDMGTTEDVGGYFDLIKGNFKKLFMLSLATFGIAIAATLACYLPIFYVMVPLQLVVVFFAFHPELSVSEIIKASFKLGNKYWLTIFGLIIVAGLIAQLGLLLCLVGVFVTAFFVHIPMYFIYKDTVGMGLVTDRNTTPTGL
ncbi:MULTISPECIES: hypothetical protein [Altibacter]|uniref:hypothetical protein n=1 Tax=Altibacter TaxID=1535231 RepID=UPI000690679C|nr:MULTISPECIES: hypothetical protein [Altibacter]MCW8980762.1 hypothetical protein [Altibacter sp.]MCW9038481.1 hypothetical protein [Altibacter sp.]